MSNLKDAVNVQMNFSFDIFSAENALLAAEVVIILAVLTKW